MSLYLAIETATDAGSVAVGAPGRVRSEVGFTDRRHAADLVPAVMEALRLAHADFTDLAGVVLGDGPGSFTGLRIGLATAKGILAGREELVLRVAPSLMAAAWIGQQFFDGPVAALYDAYRGEVFGAVYHADEGTMRALVPPGCGAITDLIQQTAVTPAGAVGDGAVAFAAEVGRWIGRKPVGPPEGAPRARALLELLGLRGTTRVVEDAEAFEPTYGRRAAAEDRWETTHGRSLPDSNRSGG